jgi:molybdopterin converting factor subunit 1
MEVKTMQINVLLFATLKDQIGSNRIEISVPDASTVAQVRAALADRYPSAEAHLKAAIAAVNEEYADNTIAVHDGDTVAFFPPVSGGNFNPPEIIRLSESRIDHDEVVTSITTPATGAVCLFSGIVRGSTQKEGHIPEVAFLEYEAYESMALAKMRQVADEIRERWPGVQGIAIIQRLGRLQVGENTILIACSSGHRDEGCFEGARYGIDRLKEIVPVWKKEVGVQGQHQTWIEGEYHPTLEDRSTPE